MHMQVEIPVPEVVVKNVGGATGVYKRNDPADGEYALDMQVGPFRPSARTRSRLPFMSPVDALLCNLACFWMGFELSALPGCWHAYIVES